MRIRSLVLAAVFAVASLPVRAASGTGQNYVLAGVVATTSTSETGVSTFGARYVSAQVWSAAGGTFTVLIEERELATDSTGAEVDGPWVTVQTMTNCNASGLDGTPAPCFYKTATPASRTRLRVSSRSSGTIYGILTVGR